MEKSKQSPCFRISLIEIEIGESDRQFSLSKANPSRINGSSERPGGGDVRKKGNLARCVLSWGWWWWLVIQKKKIDKLGEEGGK